MSTPRHVRKQLIIPAEIDQRLAAIAVDTGTTASEVVRKAITLYIIATEKKQQGVDFHRILTHRFHPILTHPG